LRKKTREISDETDENKPFMDSGNEEMDVKCRIFPILYKCQMCVSNVLIMD
jgi:hypothetical protein